jgi:integrase
MAEFYETQWAAGRHSDGNEAMASIRKRRWRNASGEHTAYILDYTDRDGSRHIKTFELKRDAEAERTRITGEVAAGTQTPPSRSTTIVAAGADWIAQAETDNLERATVRQYRQHLAHIDDLLGKKKLSDLTVAEVTKFRNALREAGRSAVMAKKIVSSLGAIIQHAQATKLVAQNVVRAEVQENKTATRRRRMVEKRQERQIEAGVDFPTKDEIRAMMAVTSVPDRRGRRDDADPADPPTRPIPGGHALIVIVILSGLRASELRGLKWANVNFKAKQSAVSQRADRFNKIGSLKSRAALREVPMGPYLINTLKAWKLQCPKRPEDLVFPNSVGKIETLPTIHNRILAPLQKAAGIAPPKGQKGPRYGMHSLRHAAASLWIDSNKNIKEVQRLMGHSTVAMTLDVYSHLFPQDDTDAAAKLEERLFG